MSLNFLTLIKLAEKIGQGEKTEIPLNTVFNRPFYETKARNREKKSYDRESLTEILLTIKQPINSKKSGRLALVSFNNRGEMFTILVTFSRIPFIVQNHSRENFFSQVHNGSTMGREIQPQITRRNTVHRG